MRINNNLYITYERHAVEQNILYKIQNEGHKKYRLHGWLRIKKNQGLSRKKSFALLCQMAYVHVRYKKHVSSPFVVNASLAE